MTIIDLEAKRPTVLGASRINLTSSFFKSSQHLFKRIALMRQVAMERQALRSMPDRLLKDMGISRVDANQEARIPSWNIPTDRQI